MNLITYVDIAECKLRTAPGLLACRALGSCVAVCLWDSRTRLTGLAHILLPSPASALDRSNPAKFADTGVALLVAAMEGRGSRRGDLRAKLVGGASLYHYEADSPSLDIGRRNAEASREALSRLDIPILAQHIGGEHGRNIKVDSQDFAIQVTVLSQGVVVI